MNPMVLDYTRTKFEIFDREGRMLEISGMELAEETGFSVEKLELV